MGILLREVLKSICIENGWAYAVLWKPNCWNPMILMWEDGYCEHGVHADGSFPAFGSQSLLSREGEILLNQGNPDNAKFCGNYQLDVLVAKMKDQLHVVGKGIVGHVALTETHRWICKDTYMNEGFVCSSAVYGTPFENFADWYGQFSAGIQTVAIISVSPHGVLQCGSVQRMPESLSFVNHLKSMFLHLEGIGRPSLSETAPTVPWQKLHTANSANAHGTDATKIFHVKEDSPFFFVDETPVHHLLDHPSCLLFSELQTPKSHADLNVGIYADACAISAVPSSNIPSTEAYVDSFMQKSLLSINSTIAPSGQIETASIGSAPEASSMSSMQLNQHPSQRSDALYSKSVPSVGIVVNKSFDSVLPLNCTSSLLLPSEISSTVVSGSHVVDPTNGLGEAVYSDAFIVWNSMHTKPSHLSHSNGYQYAHSNSLPLTSAFDDSKELRDIQITSSGLRFTRPSDEPVIDVHAMSTRSVMSGSIDGDLFQAIGPSFSASSLDKCDSFPRELSKIMPEFMQSTLVNDIQHTPKGNFQPIKIEPKSSSSLTVTAGGEISATYRSLNNSFDRIPLDIQASNSQSVCRSIGLQLKNVEGSGTGSGFSSFISDPSAGSMLNIFNDVQIDTSCFSESRSDSLLDAIVSSVHTYTDRSSNGCISGKTFFRGAGSSHSSDDKQEDVARVSQYPMKSETVIPNQRSLSEGSASKIAEGSQTDGTSKSQVNFRMENGPSVQHDNSRTTHTGISGESPKGKQKRPKPGESTRPRPKDRQMIQDRVKELREIVPNGAKCSIDALLERTIKHMLFLQSVTKHADKLKQTGKSKLISKDGALLLKDNFEGGATWAFEVGSKSMVCPIIVEDLNVPHQMLVEMLCEERGFFLEIAELIREMGLTILKGVIEMRDDKIWAYFAVEANRDISRMEVFMSLVHLLEQISNSTTKAVSSKTPVFDTTGQPSIPAAGSMERML